MLLRHPLVLYNYCRYWLIKKFASHCQSSSLDIGLCTITHRDNVKIINTIFTYNSAVSTARWSILASEWRINGPALTTFPGMRCAQKLHKYTIRHDGLCVCRKALWVGYQRPCPSRLSSRWDLRSPPLLLPTPVCPAVWWQPGSSVAPRPCSGRPAATPRRSPEAPRCPSRSPPRHR